MGSGDAANLTAMLSSDQGHSSLASVMTSSTFSCTGPGDLFASSSCSFLASAQKLATPRSSNIPEPGSERASAQMLEWPYPRGEKWVVDALEEPRRATNFRSNMIAPQHLSNCPPQPGGLLRYHSAPSSFLQCLDDLINEDVFTEASSPLADSDGLLAWADNLTPIIDHGSQEMEIKRGDSNSRLNDSLQDAMEESSAQLFQMPSFMPPDESMSGTTSEENGSGSHTKTSAYSAVDCYLVKEPAAASAGLWNGPPSPGKLVGNRPMSGVGEMTNEAPAWPGGSFRSGSGGEVGPKMGGLVRHSSLPATSRPFSATQDLDDLFADSSTVPLKTLRAIRGHATHPRSIAERVRRGKISERMKKLQDLIPNMDQQTNTAEMLDEAVEYVKQLQMQVQELSKTVVELQKLQEMQGRLVP